MFINDILESIFHVFFETTGITFLIIFIFNKIETNFKTTTKIASPITGSILGVTPGCAGAISASVMYKEGKAKFGFLASALIATMGDGAYILMVIDPRAFAIIAGLSFISAIFTGWILNYFNVKIPKNKIKNVKPEISKYSQSHIFNIYNKLVWKVFMILIPFISLMSLGHFFDFIPHSWVHAHWFEIIVFIASILMFINSVVINKLKSCKDSCLLSCEKTHGKWFAFKKSFDQLSHIMTILLLVLIPIKIISANISLDLLFASNKNIVAVIIIAAAVSVFPGSALQILILSLYLAGNIPFIGLLASSIASSGDATFVLFENRKKALIVAASINFILAIIISFIYLWVK